nr:hypothetical protein [Tanacetum cinerariifolium]
YNDVPPPAADLCLSPKKDLSWIGLPEFADDTVTDYSMRSPTVQKRPTTDKVETAKKPAVRYSEMYRRTSKRRRVQRETTRRAPRSKMNSVRPNKQAHSYSRRSFQETTQDLMIILIQRVQRQEKELKSRTPIHKVDRGRSRPVMAWVPKKD